MRSDHTIGGYGVAPRPYTVGYALTLLVALGLAPAAPAGTINLKVTELGTTNPVPHFTYIINENNVADPLSPSAADHPWHKPTASNSPIVAVGDDTTAANPITLPDGKYLVTVNATTDNGNPITYKLGGTHFQLPRDSAAVGPVEVELAPGPLPLGKITAYVFEDNRRVNGAADTPEGEPPLGGFEIIVEDQSHTQVTVDWFNQPLCGGHCITGPDGLVTIDNLAPATYLVEAVAPTTEWIRTSTFEGTLEDKVQVYENAQGAGPEVNVRLEPGLTTPFWYGYVRPKTFATPGTGTITGKAYNSTAFPDPVAGESIILKPHEPVGKSNADGSPVTLYVALSDIANDQQVYTQGFDAGDGSFTIENVPAGTYEVAIWDSNLDYIISFFTAVIDADHQTVDLNDTAAQPAGLGVLGVSRWFGWQRGHVYLNGVGLKNFPMDVRARDGSIFDSTVTRAGGFYEFPEILPDKFSIAEVGYDRFKQTRAVIHDPIYATLQGLLGTVGSDTLTEISDPPPGTLLLHQWNVEDMVSEVDFYKETYGPGENGGIVGIVFHDTTRNELDPRFAVAEEYQPGVPDVPVELWTPRKNANGEVLYDPNCDPTDTFVPGSGQVCLQTKLNDYIGAGPDRNGAGTSHPGTDRWSHPTAATLPFACDLRNETGANLPDPNDLARDCTEVPRIGNQTKGSSVTAGGQGAPGNGSPGSAPAVFDGGYAFSTDAAGNPLASGDYVVVIKPPPFFQITKEEDVNIDRGDVFCSQGDPTCPVVPRIPRVQPKPAVPPPRCVGALHLVADARSPFNNQQRPLCDMRLMTLATDQNANSDFFIHTDITDAQGNLLAGHTHWGPGQGPPIPGKIYGLVEDDVNIDVDLNSIAHGEKRRVPHLPVGIRDPMDYRLIQMTETDEYGNYEVLLPSTHNYNCPIPQGVCPAVYEIVVNDPGDDRHPSPNYQAGYLTAQSTWDVWPGLMTFADTPVDPIATGADCTLPDGSPEIFRVSQPNGAPGNPITITGLGFGNGRCTVSAPVQCGNITLDSFTVPAGNITTWSNEQIVFNIPSFRAGNTVTGFRPGPKQLLVTNNTSTAPIQAGRRLVWTPETRNGITLHVTGSCSTSCGSPTPIAYNPTIVTVSAPTSPTDHKIQDAVDGAAAGSLVLVPPGVYHENVIISKLLKLQGYGPGGVLGVLEVGTAVPADPNHPPTGTVGDPRRLIPGSIIDGRFFFSHRQAWETKLDSLAHAQPSLDSSAEVSEGAVITVLAPPGGFPNGGTTIAEGLKARIDGLAIAWGQGSKSRPTGINTSAGGIYVHAGANNLRITNNLIESNGGGAGGGISLGQDRVGDNHNYNVDIRYNRLLQNGGAARAGGIGLFTGANGYNVVRNDMCGNVSLEYGGGMSHYGRSPNGTINNNRIYYNHAYDEGGGVMIAGEVTFDNPCTGRPCTKEAGNVALTQNIIQENLSGDDGGGVRLLLVGARDYSGNTLAQRLKNRIDIVNNMIDSNVAAHQGGGLALDDATNVTIVNNTVADNQTTGTGEGAVGQIHAAGLSSEANSAAFQALLPGGAQDFSDPVMFNNIFWNNTANAVDPSTFTLVSATPPMPDFEVVGTVAPEFLNPQRSILSVGYLGGANNVVGDPLFVDLVDLVIDVGPSRVDPGFITISLKGDPGLVPLSGDYHIQALQAAATTSASQAVNRGVFGVLGNTAVPTLINPLPPAALRFILAPFIDSDTTIVDTSVTPRRISDIAGQARPRFLPGRLVPPLNNQILFPWDLGADEKYPQPAQ